MSFDNPFENMKQSEFSALVAVSPIPFPHEYDCIDSKAGQSINQSINQSKALLMCLKYLACKLIGDKTEKLIKLKYS